MKEFDSNEFEQLESEFDCKTADEMYAEFLTKVEKPKDEFIYYYGKYYRVMTQLTGAAKDLMTWLTFSCDMNTGRVFVQSETLKEALKELGITMGTYYKALNLLKEKGLIKGGHAKFYVNPAYAWKGTADMRNKFIRIYNMF